MLTFGNLKYKNTSDINKIVPTLQLGRKNCGKFKRTANTSRQSSKTNKFNKSKNSSFKTPIMYKFCDVKNNSVSTEQNSVKERKNKITEFHLYDQKCANDLKIQTTDINLQNNIHMQQFENNRSHQISLKQYLNNSIIKIDCLIEHIRTQIDKNINNKKYSFKMVAKTYQNHTSFQQLISIRNKIKLLNSQISEIKISSTSAKGSKIVYLIQQMLKIAEQLVRSYQEPSNTIKLPVKSIENDKNNKYISKIVHTQHKYTKIKNGIQLLKFCHLRTQ